MEYDRQHACRKGGLLFFRQEGWRMVKSETRRDAETLVRNPSPRLFGKKFRDSKKVKTNHAKTRLRDLSKTLPRFRDPVKIFRDLRLSRYHSPPLASEGKREASEERNGGRKKTPVSKATMSLHCRMT